MCGILFLCNKHFIGHPKCLGNDFIETNQYLFPKQLQLSQADENKLNHFDELKSLNDQLIRLNNFIKYDVLDEINDIKQQISNIIGPEEGKPIKFHHSLDIFDSLIPHISHRGPDYLAYKHLEHKSYNLQLVSSVLSLRKPFTKQPIVSSRYILQFNGELYDSELYDIGDVNDSEYLMMQLNHYGIDILYRLNGEYCFNVIDLHENKVYFGRDSVGKRSLCYEFNGTELILSSVASNVTNLIECEANKLYELDLNTFSLKITPKKFDFHPITELSSMDESIITNRLAKLHAGLRQACSLRQDTISPLTKDESDLGILFSGGIDCTILASLIIDNFILQHKYVNVDLLTVGFDNPRTGLKAHESPDRQSSLRSWFHLCKKYPNYSIRLIELNIDYRMWLLHKTKVESLIYPQQTEMDQSISTAFYFASNNIIPCKKLTLKNYNIEWDQFVNDPHSYLDIQDYLSKAKVLFSGLGADELFGGYSRHQVLFNPIKSNDDPKEKYNELTQLLINDIEIIYSRNLGRDDRIISSWGKELRYPYLDINMIKLVIDEIEPNLKVKLDWITTKKGEKIMPTRKWILRQLADYIGLGFVKDEPKRAIQFGSKSAKFELGQGRNKGTDLMK